MYHYGLFQEIRFNLQDGKVFKSLVNIKKVSDIEILIPFHLCDKCKHCITIDSILYFNLYKSPHYEIKSPQISSLVKDDPYIVL